MLHDPDDLTALVLKQQKKGVLFVCPICKNRYHTDVTGIEPVCTGPNLVKDEHAMEPMIRVPE